MFGDVAWQITHWNIGLGSLSSRLYPQSMCQATEILEHRHGKSSSAGCVQEHWGGGDGGLSAAHC